MDAMSNLLFSPVEHEAAFEQLRNFTQNYHEKLDALPVYPDLDREQLNDLKALRIPQEGASLEDLFHELSDVILPNSTHTAHSRFLPYVQPTPNALAPYADYIAAVLNQNCNLWRLSPAANAVEQNLINWFRDLFHLPEDTGGIITSGGSMANLLAINVARDYFLNGRAKGKGLQNLSSPLIVYCSEETHSSVDKAVIALGIGGDHLRKIPTDDQFRIDLSLLEEAVHRDRALGLTPFCIVGNAGSVTTGSFDPIDALADFAEQEDLWLHVDGAYGALSALSPRYSDQLTAVGRVDSISLDPHKFLFCSFEAGSVLVRNKELMRAAFASSPSYLAMQEDPDFLDYANYGLQLSRGFKALKVWWSVKYFGANAYRQVVERMSDLAHYMQQRICACEGMTMLAPVTFNCVCFRLDGLDDEGNRSALVRLIESGVGFLGPVNVKGKIGLRACFMNLRTSKDDIDLILAELNDIRWAMMDGAIRDGAEENT
jgi:glutamate/tyrosine decarboxylase-like PLP-dependent enzyme